MIQLNDGDDLYSPSNVLRYVSAKDDEGTERPLYPDDGSGDTDSLGVTIVDYDQIKVHDDTVGAILTITYLGLPLDHNLNDDVRQGDEEALRYYILARAYEKETDMENFAKSDKFEFKFRQMLESLIANKSMNYNNSKVNTTTSYSY